MKPTIEQHDAINMSMAGQSCKIMAYAGAGKTSTLKLIGNAKSNQSGMYLAFNKAIATEAQSKFNSNVSCRTFHSLAYSNVPRWLTGKLKYKRMMPSQLASRYGLQPLKAPVALSKQRSPEDDKSRLISVNKMAACVVNTVGYFCRSNHVEIQLSQAYAALPDWIEDTYRADLAHNILSAANSYWSDILNPNGVNRLEHDHYLKYWSLGRPIINTDFVLFDEAQDADPIMLDVLQNQGSQIIYVGDRHQQIYGFRGAINAMQSLQINEKRLSQSFRFGENIADLANNILFNCLDEEIPVRGFSQIESRVGNIDNKEADAFIFRTNAAALSNMVYLSHIGRNPRIEIDTKSLIKDIEDAKKIKAGLRVSEGSCFEGFNTWKEVLTYVQDVHNSDIKPLVALIEKVGEDALILSLSKSDDDYYDCVVTTAHKSKGLEFDKVILGGDFFYKTAPKDGEAIIAPDEARLLYVAATRAKKELDITLLNPLFRHIGANKNLLTA